MNRPMFKDFIAGKRQQPVHQASHKEEVVQKFLHHEGGGFSVLKLKNLLIFTVSILSLFAVLFYFSSALNSAIVKITPAKEKVLLDDIFVASLNGKEGESVPFKIMKTEESEIVAIAAQGVEKVSKKASGEIVVYNNYSESAQKLIIGTRFETEGGKIYKIDKPISIPGRKTVNGKTVPGSLTVTVYASDPGSEYNIGPSDFTIPGLKGGSRFTSVFARGKGDITGGFVGEIKTVSPSDVLLARKKLEDSLRLKLVAKAEKQIPEGYILFGDASFLNFSDNATELGLGAEGDKVNLLVKGSLKAAIFNGGELSQFIAKNKIQNLENYDVHSNNLGSLIFKVIAKDSLDLDTSKSFSFRITGPLQLVWNFDSLGFTQSLAGLSKDKYQDVFKKYPMVEKAETIFKPSWSRSFPDSADDITVQILED